MIPKTYAQAKAEKQKSAARKVSRAAKRKELWAGKPGFDKRGKPWSLGKIRKRVVRLLGLRDKALNGPLCRLGEYCPHFYEVGPHEGELAYHLVPQNEGEAARLDPPNVVWACRSANEAERRRRAYFAQVHEKIFGKLFMDERWRIASMTIHNAKRADLVAMLAELEAAYGTGIGE
jgi:hypothetical protein